MKSNKNLKYKSAFDIIGPIMIGPSSSHTAGAVRIANMARQIYKKIPKKLVVTFYGSFAETYKGHGTALAIVAGILGFETNDERIPEAIQIAEKQNMVVEFSVSDKKMNYANTVNLELIDGKETFNMTAVSIGGGSIQLTEINHHDIMINQKQSNRLVFTSNQPGKVIPAIENRLKSPAFLKIQQLDQESIFLVETDSDVSQKLVAIIKEIPGITAVMSTAG